MVDVYKDFKKLPSLKRAFALLETLLGKAAFMNPDQIAPVLPENLVRLSQLGSAAFADVGQVACPKGVFYAEASLITASAINFATLNVAYNNIPGAVPVNSAVFLPEGRYLVSCWITLRQAGRIVDTYLVASNFAGAVVTFTPLLGQVFSTATASATVPALVFEKTLVDITKAGCNILNLSSGGSNITSSGTTGVSTTNCRIVYEIEKIR